MRLLPALALTLAATPAAAAPLFQEQTNRLGMTQPCAATNEGCYSSYVVLADLDGDADLDIVFASGGGYYEPDTTAPMAVYLNDGGAQFTEVGATAVGGFAGRLRQVTVGDIDGDGDNDIVAPDGYGMQADAVFVNDGAQPPVFAEEGATRLGTTSRAGAVRLGDLDGDADLDLVITDWGAMPPMSAGTAKVYLNDGTGKFTELEAAVPSDTATIGTGPIDIDLFDADGDFDLDLLLASRVNESLFFTNDGAGHFTSAQDALPDQPGPYVYGPDPCDVDGDGDLDLWLDNGFTQRREQLLINGGTGSFTDETAARVMGNTTADDNEVQCADIDADGDFDAVVASLSLEERWFDNAGGGMFAAATDTFPPAGDATLGLDFGDLDGDGRLDAVTAQGETGDFLNRVYMGAPAQAVDDDAPVIRAVETTGGHAVGADLVVRFAVSDRATSDVGPRLAGARLEFVAAGEPAVAARFAGGDLYAARLARPAEPVEVRVCADDVAMHTTCSDPFLIGGALPEADAGPVGPDAGGDGGDTGDTGDDEASDDCGCQAGGSPSPGGLAGLGFALLALVALGVRRVRR